MDIPQFNHSNSSGSQAIAVNEAERRQADSLTLPPREEPNYPSSGSGYGGREESDGMDLQRLLAIVARRWPVMLGIFLAASAIGAFTALRSKPIYQAGASVEVTGGQQSGAGAGGDVPGLERFTNNSQSIETQIEIMKGGAVMGRAFSKVSPAQRQVLANFAPVTINQVGLTRLLNVSVQSYNPEAAAALANSICNEYIANSLEKNNANTRGAATYVEKRLKKVGDDLANAQLKLRDFQEKTGIYSISDEASALATKAGLLRSDIESSQADRQSLLAKISGLQSQLARLPASRIVASGIERNPRAIQLRGQLAQLNLERTIALNDYKPGSIKIRAIDSQIQAVQGQLKTEAGTIVSGWRPDPLRAPIAGEFAASQSQLRSLNARVAALQGQSAQAQQNLLRLPQQQLQFTRLSSQVQVLNSTYQMLNSRLQGLKIGEQGNVADARPNATAYPNPVPVAPNKPRTVIYAMAVGLMAALGIGLLLDLMDNHVYTEDDVQRVTGLPVLVQVPLFNQKQPHNLLMAPETVSSKSSPLLETFRMLRTNIRLSSIDRNVRSVAITSSVPHEGKSNTALSLAVAAATSGDRVVLVDLDLRRPSIHRLCEISNEIGFTSIITGTCSLEEALQDTKIPGLRVLASGPVPPNPFRMLNSQAAKALIEQITQGADLVVIDTPPVLAMADALLISSWVDGTLLVVSSSEIRKKDVARAADMLTQNNNDVLGVVLTKVGSNVDGYYSYYGYKNYNHYFESNDTIALK